MGTCSMIMCGAMLRFDATDAHLTGVKAATFRRDNGQWEAAERKK